MFDDHRLLSLCRACHCVQQQWCIHFQHRVDAEIACEMDLHQRLSYLLAEMEPYEQKLIQLNRKMKIKLRKEHENYVEEPPDKQQVNKLTVCLYWAHSMGP